MADSAASVTFCRATRYPPTVKGQWNGCGSKMSTTTTDQSFYSSFYEVTDRLSYPFVYPWPNHCKSSLNFLPPTQTKLFKPYKLLSNNSCTFQELNTLQSPSSLEAQPKKSETGHSLKEPILSLPFNPSKNRQEGIQQSFRTLSNNSESHN